MVAGGVVHHQVGDHADPPRVRGVDQVVDVLDRPVVGMDVGEVGDVVAAVAQRRAVEGQQPDAVDAQPLQVVELLGQAAEVARAVAVGVIEAADVDLVEHRPLEPQRLGLEPLARLGSGRGRGPARPRWRARRAAGLGGDQMRERGRADATSALDLG